jgi:hypothetical protein
VDDDLQNLDPGFLQASCGWFKNGKKGIRISSIGAQGIRNWYK